MKILVALFITAILTSIPPKLNINNTVAVSNPSQKTSQEVRVKATTKVQEIQDQTVTPVTTSVAPDCNSYDALIIENFGSENLITAKAIMRAESGCRSDAVGDGHITYVQNGVTYGMSCGLFQIRHLPGRPSCEQMKTPSENIIYAGHLFASQGWKPWGAWLNQSYKRFLN